MLGLFLYIESISALENLLQNTGSTINFTNQYQLLIEFTIK